MTDAKTNPNASLNLVEQSRSIGFEALRIVQPVGEFYIAVMSSDKLAEIAFFDIRGLTKHNDFAEFLGIQRELDPSRVADLKRYVRTSDASFPTAVVLAVDERCATVEPLGDDPSSRAVRMTLTNYNEPEEGLDPILYREIARVIDGQHRIAGLIGYEGEPFDVNVAIFVGADIATQATLFATVNLAQTKVNRSLVYDLLSYQRTRSPDKTCHEIAVLLDREEASPFHKRIKRLGVSTDGRFSETLAQASFVKGLIVYISRDVLADREAARRGKPLPEPHPRYKDDLLLRPFFVTGKDEIIAQIMWDYFAVVSEKWQVAWNKTGRGWVLNKTAGYAGLMRFLGVVLRGFGLSERHIPTKADFRQIFAQIELPDEAFESRFIRPGSSGERYVLQLLTGEQVFRPTQDYSAATDEL